MRLQQDKGVFNLEQVSEWRVDLDDTSRFAALRPGRYSFRLDS
jgi:hypothetical protein